MARNLDLSGLLPRTENVRNICLLAHVDHGKTTISDFLVSSNGYISSKLAGSLRYMDSREDEQQRLITMKSSSITLVYVPPEKKQPLPPPPSANEEKKEEGQEEEQKKKKKEVFLVNLIDSPGHVDFSSEVSSAVRMSDGALIVVDCIEGICVQTHAVLQQAWNEGVTPCLVVNKIDRLVIEAKMSPEEAYHHINLLIENINGLVSTFHTKDLYARAAAKHDAQASSSSSSSFSSAASAASHKVKFGKESGKWEFDPVKGNVVFCSAVDRFAFHVPMMAEFWAPRLGLSVAELRKALWGNFYFSHKSKKISTKPGSKGKPMFVSLILENIWNVYRAVIVTPDKAKITKITGALKIKVPTRELNDHNEPRDKLRSIMSRWLPVPNALLGMVCEHIPSPADAQKLALPRIWRDGLKDKATPLALRKSMVACDSKSPHVVIYVSKMMDADDMAEACANPAELPKKKTYVRGLHKGGQDDKVQTTVVDSGAAAAAAAAADKLSGEDQKGELVAGKRKRFIGLARVYCGTVSTDFDKLDPDTPMYCFGPKFDPKDPESYVHRSQVRLGDIKLFLLKGRDRQPVGAVPAGNVCGIGGVDLALVNTGTISSFPTLVPIQPMQFQSSAILRVAIEPVVPSEMPELAKGLKLINKADLNVEISVLPTGEHVIATSGEMHLQRCLKDLKERFTKGIRMRVSPPLIAFRETIVRDHSKLQRDQLRAADKSGKRKEQVRKNKKLQSAVKLNDAALDILEDVFVGDKEAEYKQKEMEQKMSRTLSITQQIGDSRVCVTVKAEPMPKAVLAVLEENQALLKQVNKQIVAQGDAYGEEVVEVLKQAKDAADAAEAAEAAITAAAAAAAAVEGEEEEEEEEELETKKKLSDEHTFWRLIGRTFKRKGKKQTLARHIVRSVLSFGSTFAPCNMLVEGPNMQEQDSDHDEKTFAALRSSVISGFRMACTSGPLCEEPMMGVVFVLESVTLAAGNVSLPTPGQTMGTLKSMFRLAFQKHAQRLMQAVFKVELQVDGVMMGQVESVIMRRKGRILDSQDVVEGTTMFVVTGYIAVQESFGFASEIREKTGGSANPQLVFGGWEAMKGDPNWVPTTEKEIEEFGRLSLEESNQLSVHSNVKNQIAKIRKRKGLTIPEKLVKHAEKQRTLARKK